jgi:hypothetical protein
MPTITDIFNNRPFKPVELTNAIQLVTPIPTLLGTLGEDLFTTVRSRTRDIAILRQNNVARLVPVSAVGSPPVELEPPPGATFDLFRTRRLAKASTITAEELQGVLTLPDFQAVQEVQTEVATRAGRVRDDIELTEEHMRFGAVLGKVLDADGVTVLDDWYAQWGVSVPSAFNFHLDVTTTNIRAICDAITMAMYRASQGGFIRGRTRVSALCGDAFFTALVNHPTVVATYMNWAAAVDLRGMIPDYFDWGGIRFYRWIGESTVDLTIPTDEARFFPIGGMDIFQRVMGPGEFFPFINQPGQDVYALTINDRDRDAWVKVEQYNYPLYMCLRPEVLQRGIRA